MVTLFFSHKAQRTQQTLIISPDSDSEAQFTLGHPLTAWLNSHWIRRYLFFPLLEEQRTHGQQSRRPLKPTITQYPTFWNLLNQTFLTLLEMSHFPTNPHHDNCHPWKLPHLVSFPIMSLSHPCSCLFPHSGR